MLKTIKAGQVLSFRADVFTQTLQDFYASMLPTCEETKQYALMKQ